MVDLLDGKNWVNSMFYRLTFYFIFLLVFNPSLARVVKYDSQNMLIENFFNKADVKYVIRYSHSFSNNVSIPKDSELSFQGGALSGPIKFVNTKLSGDVKLQGSTISGTVSNLFFLSEWLCYADGSHDDADNINQMIEVCGKVNFKEGVYLLRTLYRPVDTLDKKLWKYPFHLGINRSNVVLKGRGKDVVFRTKEVAGMICIYSLPNRFDRTVLNVTIDNITFKTENDGVEFHEYLHTIKTIGVDGMVIKNCKFYDFWCDAICLSTYGDTPATGERTRNSNVRIMNNTIIGGKHYNTGDGVAVVNGKNILIDHNIIKQVSRKHMPGAIDIEANNSAYTVDGITISNNIIENCQGTAGGIAVNANQYGAPAHNIKILNNQISGCSNGIVFYVKSDNTTSNYLVAGNVIAADTPPYRFYGKGKSSNWVFKKNIIKRPTFVNIPGDIKVAQLLIKNNRYAFTKD